METNSFPADFDAAVSNFDHFDFEPALVAEFGDGLLDLFEAGGEGADVDG